MSLLGKWRYILQLQTIFFNCPIFLLSLTPPVNATFQLKGMGLYILSVHMTKTLMPESFVLYPAANLLSSMWCSSTGIFSFCFYCLQRVKKKKGKMLIKLEHGYMKKWTENLQQDLSEIWPGHLSKEDVHLHPLCGDCAVQFSIKQRKINRLWLCFTCVQNRWPLSFPIITFSKNWWFKLHVWDTHAECPVARLHMTNGLTHLCKVLWGGDSLGWLA